MAPSKVNEIGEIVPRHLLTMAAACCLSAALLPRTHASTGGSPAAYLLEPTRVVRDTLTGVALKAVENQISDQSYRPATTWTAVKVESLP